MKFAKDYFPIKYPLRQYLGQFYLLEEICPKPYLMFPIILFQMIKKEDDRTDLEQLSFNFPERMKLYSSYISGVEVKSKQKWEKEDSFRRLLRQVQGKLYFLGFGVLLFMDSA